MKSPILALAFFTLLARGWTAAPEASINPGISRFVETYFSSWSKADFHGYRSCFHPSATVTFHENREWRQWELQQFLNDQEQMQAQQHLEEVPLAIHVKEIEGDVAFVEVPWRLKLMPKASDVTGIDWYILVRHDQTWQILNLTFWEDAKESPARTSSPGNQPALQK